MTIRPIAALALPVAAGAAALLAGCVAAGPQPDTASVGSLDAARAAAVADIRAKAAAAETRLGETPPVFASPEVGAGPTPDEVAAIEAELSALAEAQKSAASSAELAALKRRAAALERLRVGHAAEAAAGIAAASRASD